MTQELVQPRPWPGRRWWTLVALVFMIQLGLIFWLGKPESVVPQPAELVPSLRLLSPGAAPMLALTDPTLFALPHREGFSGAAWLTVPPQEFRPFVWSEPPRPLTLAQEQLGMHFKWFMATNHLEALQVLAQPQLELMLPVVARSESFPTQSVLRLMGGLAGRHLVVSPALRSWPAAELITNSVVQVLVAADGRPFSPILLKNGVANEADQYALRQARNARFEPVKVKDPTNPLAGLSWGQMVFEWHTLPLAVSNNVTVPATAK